jgi:hypothetical protein
MTLYPVPVNIGDPLGLMMGFGAIVATRGKNLDGERDALAHAARTERRLNQDEAVVRDHATDEAPKG